MAGDDEASSSTAPNRPSALVLGANGFIGRHVIDVLLERGTFDVHGLVRDDSTTDAGLLKRAGVHLHVGDLTRAGSLERAMAGMQVVINCAGHYAWSHAGDPSEFQRVNFEGVRTAIEVASRCHVSRFVHVSTMLIFGETLWGRSSTDPIVDPLATPIGPPSSEYARTMHLGVKAALEYHRRRLQSAAALAGRTEHGAEHPRRASSVERSPTNGKEPRRRHPSATATYGSIEGGSSEGHAPRRDSAATALREGSLKDSLWRGVYRSLFGDEASHEGVLGDFQLTEPLSMVVDVVLLPFCIGRDFKLMSSDPSRDVLRLKSIVRGETVASVMGPETHSFTYIHVKDAALAIVNAAVCPSNGGHVYMVGGYRMTPSAFYDLLQTASGTPRPRVDVPPWLVLAGTVMWDTVRRVTGMGSPLSIPADLVRTYATGGVYYDSARSDAALGVGSPFRPISDAFEEALRCIKSVLAERIGAAGERGAAHGDFWAAFDANRNLIAAAEAEMPFPSPPALGNNAGSAFPSLGADESNRDVHEAVSVDSPARVQPPSASTEARRPLAANIGVRMDTLPPSPPSSRGFPSPPPDITRRAKMIAQARAQAALLAAQSSQSAMQVPTTTAQPPSAPTRALSTSMQAASQLPLTNMTGTWSLATSTPRAPSRTDGIPSAPFATPLKDALPPNDRTMSFAAPVTNPVPSSPAVPALDEPTSPIAAAVDAAPAEVAVAARGILSPAPSVHSIASQLHEHGDDAAQSEQAVRPVMAASPLKQRRSHARCVERSAPAVDTALTPQEAAKRAAEQRALDQRLAEPKTAAYEARAALRALLEDEAVRILAEEASAALGDRPLILNRDPVEVRLQAAAVERDVRRMELAEEKAREDAKVYTFRPTTHSRPPASWTPIDKRAKLVEAQRRVNIAGIRAEVEVPQPYSPAINERSRAIADRIGAEVVETEERERAAREMERAHAMRSAKTRADDGVSRVLDPFFARNESVEEAQSDLPWEEVARDVILAKYGVPDDARTRKAREKVLTSRTSVSARTPERPSSSKKTRRHVSETAFHRRQEEVARRRQAWAAAGEWQNAQHTFHPRINPSSVAMDAERMQRTQPPGRSREDVLAEPSAGVLYGKRAALADEYYSQFTFQPSINDHSRELASHRTVEHLAAESVALPARREALRAASRDVELRATCPFQPQTVLQHAGGTALEATLRGATDPHYISDTATTTPGNMHMVGIDDAQREALLRKTPAKKYADVPSVVGEIAGGADGVAHEMLRAWATRHEERMREGAEARRRQEMAECTFHPSVNTSVPAIADKAVTIPGMDRHMELRELKLRYDRELAARTKRAFATGENWRPEVPEPRPFRFATEALDLSTRPRLAKALVQMADAECTFQPNMFKYETLLEGSSSLSPR